MDYQSTVDAVYAAAAAAPQPKLCCTQTPVWKLPGLTVPQAMLEKNYGCGSTVFPRDLADAKRVLYVGVGAGMEALQMAYFVREKGGVIGVDRLPEMLSVAGELLDEAARVNPWFDRSFVELRRGDALDLPIESGTADVAAQNCLFNI